MNDVIQELSHLSKKLNQESNNVNSIITSVDLKLAKLNLGVEVWLYGSLLQAGDYEDTYDDEGRRETRQRDVMLLGYCRVEGDWQIAVKSAIFQTQFDHNGQEYEETVNPKHPVPLVDASRELRINSMSLLPSLLSALKKKAESLLAEIEKAEKAAIKL